MCSKRFFKSLLVAFLILCVSSSSLFALAFLPEYSGDSERGNTGLLSILQSMTSPKYDESLPPSDNFEKVVEDKKANDDGTVSFTQKELKEIDRILGHAEKTLKDEVRPFHFTIMPTVAYAPYTVVAPGLEAQFRYDDLVVMFGYEYDIDVAKDLTQFDRFHGENQRVRFGLGVEL